MPPASLSDQEAMALGAYAKALDTRFGSKVVDALLFGAWARGQGKPGSDLDIVVILERPTEQDLSDIRGLGFDIWLHHRVFLSVRAMSKQAWQVLADTQSTFYRTVTRDGISLFSPPA